MGQETWIQFPASSRTSHVAVPCLSFPICTMRIRVLPCLSGACGLSFRYRGKRVNVPSLYKAQDNPLRGAKRLSLRIKGRN